jgi:hypothetical protein
MIRLVPIEVQCHSGYKADEYPKCFLLDNDRFEICQITDRWYQGDSNPEYPVSNYFKVETTCGKQFIIKHELEKDTWYLCQK